MTDDWGGIDTSREVCMDGCMRMRMIRTMVTIMVDSATLPAEILNIYSMRDDDSIVLPIVARY